MIKKILKLLARFQVRHPYAAVLIILAVSSITLALGESVRTVASLENMMPTSVDEIQSFRLLRDVGLGQDMIAVVLSIDRQSTLIHNRTILDQEVVAYMQTISRTLQRHTDVLAVYSASDIFAEDINRLTSTQFQEQIRAAQLNTYISQDEESAILIVKTDVSADDDRMRLLSTQVRDDIESLGRPAHIRYTLTGTPIIQQRLGELISADRVKTQNISTLLVFLVTALVFGAITTAVVPILVVTLSVMWLYGIMGLLDLPISTLAGGVAAMVIGIGIDYAIHLMNKFKNERKKGVQVQDAIETAVQHTGMSLLGASIATMLAFIAFLVGSMPEMGRFGLLMALGVATSYIIAIFGLPAFLVLEERIIARFAKRTHFGIDDEYMLCKVGETIPHTHQKVPASHIEHMQVSVVKRK